MIFHIFIDQLFILNSIVLRGYNFFFPAINKHNRSPEITVTATVEKGSKPKTKHADPWAGFKGLSSDDVNVPAKKPRREKNETPSPHVYLKCGIEMARGRDFYKKRHWEQKHADEPPGQYNTMIVPVDHERAVKMRKEKKTVYDLPLPKTQSQTKKKVV